MTKIDLKNYTDLQLLTIYKTDDNDKMKAAEVLFDRYYPLVCKMQHKLNNTCYNYKYSLDDEDYLTDAWDAFIKSMDSSKLDKIKREDYGHFIRFKGYLQAMNRDIVHAIIKKKKNTTPLEIYNNNSSNPDKATNVIDLNLDKTYMSSEEEYFKSYEVASIRKSINKVKKSLNSTQLIIFNGLESQVKKNQICKDLGISMYRLNYELKGIQKALKKELSNYC